MRSVAKMKICSTLQSDTPYPAAVVKPDNFRRHEVLALVGLRLKDPRGRLENTFLELEAGAPFYQDLNGPQPSEDWRFSASFVLSF